MRRTTTHIRLDANHQQIVDVLRAHEFEVIVTLEPVDCLIYNKWLDRSGWLEIKTRARNTNIKRTQIAFMADTQMPCDFATTPEEALIFAEKLEGLTDKQKANLGIFLLDTQGTKDEKKAYHPAVIERVLKWD